MINDTLPGSLECLNNESIVHSAFFSKDGIEVHIWSTNDFENAFTQLSTRYNIKFDSIVRAVMQDFYIIKF